MIFDERKLGVWLVIKPQLRVRAKAASSFFIFIPLPCFFKRATLSLTFWNNKIISFLQITQARCWNYPVRKARRTFWFLPIWENRLGMLMLNGKRDSRLWQALIGPSLTPSLVIISDLFPWWVAWKWFILSCWISQKNFLKNFHYGILLLKKNYVFTLLIWYVTWILKI